jgi:hypothetical protein
MFAGAATLALAIAPAALQAQEHHAQHTDASRSGAAVELPTTTAEANREALPGPPVREVIPARGPGQPETVVTTYPGNLTPPPVAALDKDYPLCSRTRHDSCRNRGEGRHEVGKGG